MRWASRTCLYWRTPDRQKRPPLRELDLDEIYSRKVVNYLKRHDQKNSISRRMFLGTPGFDPETDGCDTDARRLYRRQNHQSYNIEPARQRPRHFLPFSYFLW